MLTFIRIERDEKWHKKRKKEGKRFVQQGYVHWEEKGWQKASFASQADPQIEQTREWLLV